MTCYSLLLVAHLVLFAYWLGGDVGVFYSSYRVCDPSLGREARLASLRIMMWIDMIPRYCLVLTLPVGLSIAVLLGWWAAPGTLVGAAWVLSLGWLWMVWAIHHFEGRPLAQTLRRLDLGVRIVVIATLLYVGVAGLAGAGPVDQPWLAAKLVLYAALVFCGLMIRVMIGPFGPVFGRIVQGGSTPELEAELTRTMNRARPFVVAIWIGLVAMAYLGAVKPALG
jgi:hypothetical protein